MHERRLSEWDRLKAPEPVDFGAWFRRIAADVDRCPNPYPEEAERERRETRRDRLAAAGLSIPAHAEDAILAGHLRDTLAIRATRRFMKGRDAFLLLSGPTGRGKTLACGLIVADHGGLAVTGPELIRTHAAAGHDRDAQARKERLYAAPLLVLDELARDDELVRHEKTAVFGLINARVARGKRTLITTNRSPAALYERYENVAFNRLMEQGSVVLLEDEPDLRAERIARRAQRPRNGT